MKWNATKDKIYDSGLEKKIAVKPEIVITYWKPWFIFLGENPPQVQKRLRI